MSVAYVGPKSRTARPRKTKIGIEVAHVTRDWEGRHFQDQKVKGQLAGGGGILCRPPAQFVVVFFTITLKAAKKFPLNFAHTTASELILE